MFDKKKCPNCGMYISIKKAKYIDCPYCDVRLTILPRNRLSMDKDTSKRKLASTDSDSIHTKPFTPSTDNADTRQPLVPYRKNTKEQQPPVQYEEHHYFPSQTKNRSEILIMFCGFCIVTILAFFFQAKLFQSISYFFSFSTSDVGEAESGIDKFHIGEFEDDVWNAPDDTPLVRTVPESPFMIHFCEYIFQKPIDMISTLDYLRVTSITLRHLDTFSITQSQDVAKAYAIDYRMGGENFTFYFDPYEKSYLPLENEDFTVFQNLEVLDLRLQSEVGNGFLVQGNLDLRSMQHLHTFFPFTPITLQEALAILPDPAQMKGLGLFLDKNDDLTQLPEQFPNLEELHILNFHYENADFTPLTQLSHLKRLSTFSFEDDAYLNALSSLEYLQLSDYQYVVDMDFLEYMPSLQTLSLIQQDISQLSNIPFCPTLEEIRLDTTYVSDYSVLNQMGNIKKLWVKPYKAHDFVGLDTLNQLEELHLLSSGLQKEDTLPSLESLESLNTLSIPYFFYPSIGYLPNLKDLYLYEMHEPDSDDREFFSMHDFSNTPNLEALCVYGMDVDTITYINTLQHLNTFSLLHTKFRSILWDDLLDIPSLKNIQILACNGEIALDNSALRNEHIVKLSFNDSIINESKQKENYFTNEWFETMPNLQELRLSKFSLLHLDFLNVLPHLETLDIRTNGEFDLTPIHQHPNLQTIYFMDPTKKEQFRNGLQVIFSFENVEK